MRENAKPKPFNLSRQKYQVVGKMSSSGEKLYWVYQSINQQIRLL